MREPKPFPLRSGELVFLDEFELDGRKWVRCRCSCGVVMKVPPSKWRGQLVSQCRPCASERNARRGRQNSGKF